MNKNDIYEFIKKQNIWYEITEHGVVFTMEELLNANLPYPDCEAKNLFVRDDKKEHFYLITVKGDKKVDLKKFRSDNQTRHLSFSSEEDLWNIMSLKPGSVSPFGLLNDSEHKVTFFIDKELIDGEGIIGVHPNENTATVWLKTSDLIDILKNNGTEVNVYNV